MVATLGLLLVNEILPVLRLIGGVNKIRQKVLVYVPKLLRFGSFKTVTVINCLQYSTI
jgi:hypothetical protein